ncbi:Asp-tRNA(Asn)/Glu-tRNA(Gln) amidotransferase A subunit family amidase [Priestia taiwanensis]|uniref:Amidase n=1 Tax=Priestia taiwanensis TaxID=1347902 RepID=A0A917AWM6_9BACI|nr:Asp-tRNA(Asn)/Glu-tRNA(Gln) amidotransferase A subunit family amidase [Priestia taiwanensis]GGE79386.1 hypothetical protein GCM10007140_31220 [Priestia taiwanensis]
MLKDEGAHVIENMDIPSVQRKWSYAVLQYELKHSLDNYLAKLPATIPIHSITELRAFNEAYPDQALKYGQDKLEYRNTFPNTLRDTDYLNARVEDIYFSQKEGIDAALETYDLDVILFPAYIGSTISAKAGYPSIAVPAGYMESGKPFGITFASTAYTEGMLIRIAYAFEQATKHRRKPRLSGE